MYSRWSSIQTHSEGCRETLLFSSKDKITAQKNQKYIFLIALSKFHTLIPEQKTSFAVV